MADTAYIEGIVQEAYAAASKIYGMRDAQTWAEGFSFPLHAPEVYERDANLFTQFHGSIEKLCDHHHKAMADNRLSVQRVQHLPVMKGEKCTGVSQADFRRIISIAEGGVRIQTPLLFDPQSTPPPFRKKYLMASNAINKMLYDQFLAKTLVFLPTSMARTVKGIHFAPQHWTPKKGKRQGRPIGDEANREGGIPINGKTTEGKEAVRVRLREEWGEIQHPTVDELVLMILGLADEHGWENLVLWKLDLASAFNLIRFNIDSIRLLAFALTKELTAIHITGMFGWTGTPYAFQVVTRVLSALVAQAINGKCRWYVDDGMGVSHNRDRDSDVALAMKIIRNLLGEDAVAMHKYESGRRVEFIGWLVDLNKRVITMSRRSLMKMLHLFFAIDLNERAHHHTIEVLASLTSRYSMLCRQMRPYTQALYTMSGSFARQPHKAHKLSERAKFDIQMWRTFLCQLSYDEEGYARPLESFRKRKATILIEYDSSLDSFAVGVSVLNNLTNCYKLVGYTVVESSLAVRQDSSYQNTCEYSVVLLGLLLARKLGYKHFSYDLAGDSISSLVWCDKDRVNSSLARAANIGFTLVAVDIDATVADIRHVPGVDNVVWDGLSRGKKGTEVGLDETCLVPSEGLFQQFLALCDPTRALETTLEHTLLTQTMIKLLRSSSTNNKRLTPFPFLRRKEGGGKRIHESL
jgi:hypothetical protein